MPRFTVIPTNQAMPVELIAADAQTVLILMDRTDCKEADVMRDGQYFFSVSLSPADVWRIFTREVEPERQAKPG